MAFTVEYIAGRDDAHSDVASVSSTLAVQREQESFATEAEAMQFVARLPPLHDPVLVREGGERLRGSALRLHLVQWQATGAH
jgi:hypothetical protein